MSALSGFSPSIVESRPVYGGAERVVGYVVMAEIGDVPREQPEPRSHKTAAVTLPTLSQRQRGSLRPGP